MGILEKLEEAKKAKVKVFGEMESMEAQRSREAQILDGKRSSYLGWTVEELRSKSKDEVLDYIRCRLAIGMDSTEDHKRFNMSGYDIKEYNEGCNTLESKKGDGIGSCTLSNLEVLNTFADLGIYDYTDYLFLDFYKGCPRLYYQDFHDRGEGEVKDDLGGYGTTDIIYEIFLLTIFSDKKTRRRD